MLKFWTDDLGLSGAVGMVAATMAKLGEKSDQPWTLEALNLNNLETPLVISVVIVAGDTSSG